MFAIRASPTPAVYEIVPAPYHKIPLASKMFYAMVIIDLVDSAGTEFSEKTRISPVEVGKSSLGSDDVYAIFWAVELDD